MAAKFSYRNLSKRQISGCEDTKKDAEHKMKFL